MAKVIGLINPNKQDCYQGEDFYSRFDEVESCPIKADVLERAIPKLPIIESFDEPQETVKINLFNSPDWRERLLGSWTIDGDNLHWQEGELANALSTSLANALSTSLAIEIQNGLWDNLEFQEFWQNQCQEHPQIKLVKSEGDSFTAYSKNIDFSEDYNTESLVLNPHTFSKFIEKYSTKNLKLSTDDGLIKGSKNNVLHIYVTADLSEANWAQLLEKASKNNKSLVITTAPGVKLPFKSNETCTVTKLPSPNKKIKVIKTNDIDTTVFKIQNNKDNKKYIEIDISECDFSDLWTRLDANFDEDTLKFTFNKSEQFLIKALQANDNVILKGDFTPELINDLAPKLFKNTMLDNSHSELVLCANSTANFNYINCQTLEVSKQDKLDCLEKINNSLTIEQKNKLKPYLENESLSKLQTRLTYLQNNPEQNDSQNSWRGMDSIDGNDLVINDLNIETSAEQAEQFTKQRLTAVNNILDKEAYVFLAGVTGVGKSTFVENELRNEKDELFLGESKLEEWAKSKQNNGRNILFIDEANLSARKWSEFEGLYNTPPGILVNGTYHKLSPNHKVVFAGNPTSYGDERKLANFFKRHGNAVLFKPLSTALIYQKILKPVFENKLSSTEEEQVSQKIIEVYKYICSLSTEKILISPRELQQIALLTISAKQQHPKQELSSIVDNVIHTVASGLVPEANRNDFNNKFKPKQNITNAIIHLDKDFPITKSRQVITQQLQELLALRTMRQNDAINDSQKYGGLGGIVLEGSPGVGKSALVMQVLQNANIQEGVDYFCMPVSMSLSDKKELLMKAFNKGAIVIVDEINSAPMMERFLNSLLMGKDENGNRPEKPGFMVIGTQNPASMAGRRNPSTALARRITTVKLPDYETHEIQQILESKGLSASTSSALVKTYMEKLNYAKEKHLTPAPTFRDLLSVAEHAIIAESETQNKLEISEPMPQPTPSPSPAPAPAPTSTAKQKLISQLNEYLKMRKGNKAEFYGGFFAGYFQFSYKSRTNKLSAVDKAINFLKHNEPKKDLILNANERQALTNGSLGNIINLADNLKLLKDLLEPPSADNSANLIF